MARSKFKGPFSQISPSDYPNLKNIKIYSRRSTILPEWVGLKVSIHNGKEFKEVLITDNHIGHKFGEFSPTKIPAVYKRPKKKK